MCSLQSMGHHNLISHLLLCSVLGELYNPKTSPPALGHTWVRCTLQFDFAAISHIYSLVFHYMATGFPPLEHCPPWGLDWGYLVPLPHPMMGVLPVAPGDLTVIPHRWAHDWIYGWTKMYPGLPS